MSITIKNRTIVLALFGVIVAIFVLGGYLGIRKGKSSLTDVVDSLKQVIYNKQVVIDGQNLYISSVEQENITLNRALKDEKLSKEELRKLHLKTVTDLTNAKLSINILLDSIKHSGRVVIVRDTVFKERNAILLPFSFKDSTKYYNFAGQFNEQGSLSVGLQVPVELKTYVGVGKKNREDKVSITSDNPYVEIYYLRSFKIDKPKPQKYGIGVQAGYGVTKTGLSPYVGIGIQRSILRF